MEFVSDSCERVQELGYQKRIGQFYSVVRSKFIKFKISPPRRLVQVLLEVFMFEVTAIST